ncbi:ABC transporter substrate-binding protein [Algoriphagus lacus]|uniref:ABC transporter substrate-binding protein n=1 Tax=Algoriphagus lacus TaxID=2056311 RepID=A0A418PNH4_9BACT|nr:ABC transporter substrate-binding protein [Algoriphagus lacus]RIW13303.1 ABC transporter substrate-binding protein [Algoriphagus lacus]
MKRFAFLYLIFTLVLFYTGCSEQKSSDQIYLSDWNSIDSLSRNTTVHFMMWQGSPAVNKYINSFLIPEVKKRFGIDLKISGGQGPEIVQLLMGEKQAGVSSGQVDIVWINGETFFQLRQIDGLWGPFAEQLPNARYIDFEDPYIGIDFQQPINGMEAPWGNTQFALVYDSIKLPSPPRTLDELSRFVKIQPGTFTISNDFSGMSMLKSMLAELGGSPGSLNGPFDEQKYQTLSAQLWDWINAHKPYFWKNGETFPREHTKMDQMFASGELLISYGFNEGGIEDKVLQGLFPTSTRGYAWKNGTVHNSNYLGITYNSPNRAGALQVINFMLSPEAQLVKMDVKGMNSNTVLEINRLPEEWRQKFEQATKRQYGPTMQSLEPHSIQEPAPEYMLRLFEDFRKYVIEK